MVGWVVFETKKHRGLGELWVCWFGEEKISGAKTEHEGEWERNKELGEGSLREKQRAGWGDFKSKNKKERKVARGEAKLRQKSWRRSIDKINNLRFRRATR